MIEIKGQYNSALCYCDEIEDTAQQQLQDMCDQKIFTGSRIRIMPDVHAGTGCTIGTTMTITERIAPSLVGVDIGCGMETIKLAEHNLDFTKLDSVIRNNIPSGQNIHLNPHDMHSHIDLHALRCVRGVNLERAVLSIGTLGGGNHFIEVDKDDSGSIYLVVHSGSRYLGVQVATYYSKLGWQKMQTVSRDIIDELIARYKSEGRAKEISGALRDMRDNLVACDVPEKFAYVEGQDMEDYLHDMKIVQHFAVINRQAIVQTILEGMRLTEIDRFTTIHNYIDTDNFILRKGSVSAQKGERLIIPINMRDGALICVGKGNPEWNYSAPHGAGRILSRTEAKNSLTVEQFQKEMEGVYTTCIEQSTLDESPMAYKDIKSILSQINPTVEVESQVKPVYNFKATT